MISFAVCSVHLPKLTRLDKADNDLVMMGIPNNFFIVHFPPFPRSSLHRAVVIVFTHVGVCLTCGQQVSTFILETHGSTSKGESDGELGV